MIAIQGCSLRWINEESFNGLLVLRTMSSSARNGRTSVQRTQTDRRIADVYEITELGNDENLKRLSDIDCTF